jgi:hypothetical protein|tara:strand:- start:4608 stop:4793 length:186 start_codon:yes stop_codon:yes gene_type:complete
MNQEDKAASYDEFLSEYHRLENQIGQIKMNKFDLNAEETKQVELLERKKTYIMGRVESLGQ